MKDCEVPKAWSGQGYMPKAVRGYQLVLSNARKHIDGLYYNGIDPRDRKRRWYRVRRGDRGYVPERLYEGMFPDFCWVISPRR